MLKCADCGFLAVRDSHELRLVEADDNYRDIEGFPQWDRPAFSEPVCFAMASNLRLEIEAILVEEGMDRASAAREARFPSRALWTAVIQRQRQCDSFTPWRLGFTPKEHREMLDRERVAVEQRRREEADRDWRKRQLPMTVAIATVGGVVFALLGALIESGSLP